LPPASITHLLTSLEPFSSFLPHLSIGPLPSKWSGVHIRSEFHNRVALASVESTSTDQLGMDVPIVFLQQYRYQRVLSDGTRSAASIDLETSVNSEIDSIVEFYVCFDHSYHTLQELESTILRHMKSRFLVEHDNVEGYGYGSLASRSGVARFFMVPNFCSSSKLKHPSHEDILSVALTYYPMDKPEQKKRLAQNKNFDEFVRVGLSKLYQCSKLLIGIRVKTYKPFYDSYLSAISLEMREQAIHANKLNKLKLAVATRSHKRELKSDAKKLRKAEGNKAKIESLRDAKILGDSERINDRHEFESLPAVNTLNEAERIGVRRR
jgi:hypothetical protein